MRSRSFRQRMGRANKVATPLFVLLVLGLTAATGEAQLQPLGAGPTTGTEMVPRFDMRYFIGT